MSDLCVAELTISRYFSGDIALLFALAFQFQINYNKNYKYL